MLNAWKPLVPHPREIGITGTVLRSPIALVLSLPLLLVFSIILVMVTGENESPIFVAPLIVGWLAIVIYLGWSPSARTIWGKFCMVFAALAFFLPIAALIWSIIWWSANSPTGVETIGAGLGAIALLVLAFVIGIPAGFIGWTLGYLALR